MRLDDSTHAAELFQGTTLLVNEDLCINLRGHLPSCGACSDSCEAGALTLSADRVELDDARCTRCGACVPACPAGVMRLTGFDPRRFLQALRGEPEVHLHCSASRHRDEGVVIPCHRVLDARLLAAALAEGTQRFVLHGLTVCGDCPKGDALAHIRQVQEVLKEWFGDKAPRLETLQTGERGVVFDDKHEQQVSRSRRDFLRLAGSQAVASTASWLLPVSEAPEEDALAELRLYQGDAEMQRPMPYQALLAECVDQLPWTEGSTLPWTARTLGEQCSVCMVCGQRCPTGALKAEDDNRYRSISFETALCTNCGLCAQLCPHEAIEAQPVASNEEVVAPRSLLMRRALRLCDNCGHAFAAEEWQRSLCPTCQNERELDEEWLAMLDG